MMKIKIGSVIALIEVVSIVGLIFLLGQKDMPAKFGVALVFLLPILFGLHVCEEFIFPGGGETWFALYHPENTKAYTQSYFFTINAIPLVLSTLLAFGTFDFVGGFDFFGIRAWLVFLTFLAYNAIFHIRGAIETRRFSPGLVTSILFYLPLTFISYIYLLHTGVVDIVSVIICLALGSLLQPILDAIKQQSMKEKA
jgi:hypothetical protein